MIRDSAYFAAGGGGPITWASSKTRKGMMGERGVGKRIRLHREVLALSHRKKSEDFSRKIRGF